MLPPDPRMMAEGAKPGRIHWASWVIVLAGFVVLILFAVVPGVRKKLHDKAFLQIRPNDTSERIVELMGEADASADVLPELHRYWGDEPKLTVRPDDIKSVMTWRVWFFGGGVTWQVGLNSRGRAISKHRYD